MPDKPDQSITRRELFCMAQREMTAAARDVGTLAGLATGKMLNALSAPKKPPAKKQK